MGNWNGQCRRKHVRLKLPGTFGELRITAIGTRRIRSSSRRVLVLDISPGGLRFVSGLKFPAKRNIRVGVNVTIAGLLFETEGWIVWRMPSENVYEYGVMFDISALHRSFLIRMLNQLYGEWHPERERVRLCYASLSNRYLAGMRPKIDYTV